MATKITSGISVPYTPSGADVASGAVVVLGEIHGVALAAIADGELGNLEIEGIFNVACKSADVVTVGAALYWDAGNSEATLTASTHKLLGFATEAAGDGVTDVNVKLAQQLL
jgi:predicted RecA/RadA family phage recombinase